MKEKGFFKKMREDRGARAISITVLAMFLILAVIIVITVVANRAARDIPAPYNEPEAIEPAADTNEDTAKPVLADEEEKSDITAALHFLLPVSGVLQKEHSADMQVFSETMGDYRVHLGIDIGTVAGANVSAMADGVIAQVWEDVSMGQCVAIAHSGDTYTIYKNLAEDLPETTVVGKSVKAGDLIGRVGESAMAEISEEPHLHLEMTVGGLQVSPTTYLDSAAMATLTEDTNFEDVS